MRNSRFSILVIAALVLASLALAILGPRFFDNGKPSSADNQKASSVRHIAVKAVVESENEIEIGSQVAGIIGEVRVSEGDSVEQGEILAILDSSKVTAKVEQAAAVLNEARARLRKMEAGSRTEDIDIARNRVQRAEAIFVRANDEYQRQERLYEKDAVTLMERNRVTEHKRVAEVELNEAKASLRKLSRGERSEDIDQARADVAQSAADFSYYRALLNEFRLTSPINGVVTALMRKKGETVDVGTPVMKLIDPVHMRVRAEVEETDVGKIKILQQAEIVSDAYPGKIYRGEVYKIFPDVKRKSQKTFDPVASFDINTQQIFLRLDSYSGLKNGMTVTVRFLP